ncbi:uncharacterized protein BNAC06G31740D isoform X2 [Brassica napus]|uniref:uncharacterized protein BNAC06G31740D isoform X2 n=1 Tax=Brassica napus TaxID=3708 RepID=UPI000BBF039E|nr:uncharacterized protein BNAC06G31740D isoform X2 [Brassica napus]
MQRYVLSGYHLKTLHYSLTHDLHSMRFQDLQGGGGSSIKRLATPPPLFKSVCYVFGSLGLSTMEVDMLLLDSQVSRLQLWFRVELPLVSTRLLSSVMGDQTTLGRMSISLEPMVSLMRANLGPFVNGIRLYKAKIEEQQNYNEEKKDYATTQH